MNLKPSYRLTMPHLIRSILMMASFWLVGCSLTGSSAFGDQLTTNARVLVVGDSLTVGPFGTRMQQWLQTNLGAHRVFIYGGCGASPEHMLAATPTFFAPCGYRETTPQTARLEVHRNGRKPAAVGMPKIENLIAKHRPEVVIVQMGTNHFDTLAKEGRAAIPKLEVIYDQFARALRGPGSTVRMVIWITPPDSTKFPAWVEQEMNRIITINNRKHHYGTIFSKTTYVNGTTGSDGVHYNDAGAALWITPILPQLDRLFTKYGVK
jgi:hypothetical protein